jgi:hypothetical protein
MTLSSWIRRILACAVVALIGCGVVLGRQQAGASDSGGSLAALTAEVRLLRLSIEKSADAQAQLQAMTVYLSAQQSRLLQVSARADAIRKDLDAAIRDARRFADAVAGVEKTLAMPLPAEVADPALIRRQLEGELSEAKRELVRANAVEAELRNRESEATAAVQTELARWTEMIGRLEQATRR